MLPDLLVPLSDHFQPFNLFRHITFPDRRGDNHGAVDRPNLRACLYPLA